LRGGLLHQRNKVALPPNSRLKHDRFNDFGVCVITERAR